MNMNRIMVLNNDTDIGSAIHDLLEPEGFSVSSASSEKELKEQKLVSDIDIFILDIARPDADGLELVRGIRDNSTGGIIILSAEDSECYRVASLELGADDFILKPFRPRELAARVKAVCRRVAAPRSTELVAPATDGIALGDYRLFAESRCVVNANGEEIALTTAEYNILCVLAHRQGEVLTRDEIIGLSKGRDWRCYERSVDGLISRLRRKLPVAPGLTHFIKTVHGTGYTIGRG